MAYIVMFWVGLTGWVATDAARHGRSWYGWSRLVFLTGIFGAAAWFVVRRRFTADRRPLGIFKTLLLGSAGVPLLLFTVLAGVLFVTFVAQRVRVDGLAMSPTINAGETVVVDKLAYRTTPPHRGDIVLINYPLDPAKTFIKRLIATAGDTVRIVDGQVYVNEVPLEEHYVAAAFRSHDNASSQRINDGYLYVLGDRRNNSSDSRHWGLVPQHYVVGRIREPRH